MQTRQSAFRILSPVPSVARLCVCSSSARHDVGLLKLSLWIRKEPRDVINVSFGRVSGRCFLRVCNGIIKVTLIITFPGHGGHVSGQRLRSRSSTVTIFQESTYGRRSMMVPVCLRVCVCLRACSFVCLIVCWLVCLCVVCALCVCVSVLLIERCYACLE